MCVSCRGLACAFQALQRTCTGVLQDLHWAADGPLIFRMGFGQLDEEEGSAVPACQGTNVTPQVPQGGSGEAACKHQHRLV